MISDQTAEANDAYQVDAVVALFAILLVILLTTAASLTKTPSPDSATTYKPHDRKTENFVLKTVATAYPYRSIWVIKDQYFRQIDFVALADHYYKHSTTPEYAAHVDKGSIKINPFGSYNDNFDIQIGLTGALLPDEFTKRKIPIEQTELIYQELSTAPSGSILFAWKEQLTAIYPVLSRLEETGICHKLIISPRKQMIILSRKYQDFASESIMRCY